MTRRTLDFPPLSGAGEALAAGWLRALAAGIAEQARRLRRSAANQEAARVLMRLDDWQLRDIGLTRGQIRAAADEGRLL